MELLKRGRRTCGAYLKGSRGLIFCAYRNPKDFYLDGRAGEFNSFASAFDAEKAAWAIDENELMEARYKGCVYIAIWVRKLNWLFMAPIEHFYDPHKFYRRPGNGRRAEKRYMNVNNFRTRSRAMKLGPAPRRLKSLTHS